MQAKEEQVQPQRGPRPWSQVLALYNRANGTDLHIKTLQLIERRARGKLIARLRQELRGLYPPA